MKRLLTILAVSLAITSCGPSSYLMLLDKRQTSPSGLDLAGKSIALVYLESESGVDSLFNNRLSDLLALGLEEEYFSGERAVDVLHLVKEEGGDYKSRDSLSRYVMELDSDVVLLVDVPVLVARDSKGREQYETLLYAYDSMGKDTVTVISSKYRADKLNDVSKALSVGSSLLSPLKSEWITEDFQFIYYNGSRKWTDGISYAEECEWGKATETWLDLIRESAPQGQSCAMYNIAVACFINGEYDLALEWLDQSDKIQPISLSRTLRKRIDDRKKQ